MTYKQSRGERNCNPLNLKISKNKWLGKMSNNTDGVFEQFSTCRLGYRAGCLNMYHHWKDGCCTLYKLITKLSPVCENDTLSYIRYVSAMTDLYANTPFSFTFDNVVNIVKAMSAYENGYIVDIKNVTLGVSDCFNTIKVQSHKPV